MRMFLAESRQLKRMQAEGGCSREICECKDSTMTMMMMMVDGGHFANG